jgi:ribosome-binding protein aMBF1 (putative translation factor)
MGVDQQMTRGGQIDGLELGRIAVQRQPGRNCPCRKVRPMTSSPHVIRTLPQLGMLLKSARRDKKLSQTRLAHRVGIGQSRVSELESDPSAMTLKQLMACCSEP